MICTHAHCKCTHFAVKKVTLAVCVAITNSASAAIFQPGVNETVYNQALEISYTKNDVSPTGIGFTGGTSSTPVKFDFNGNVNITLKQDSMTSDPSWSAYGVWINNSRDGSVILKFNKDLFINVQNTTNMGVGLVSGTLYTGVGMDGLNNGTTMTMHGASTVKVHGNSVIGAVAGSMFNNNSNGGGHLVFGGLHDSKQHVIHVTSDWSSNTNTSKDSDWAIGLLAFDNGIIEIQGDMDINLDVKNMKVNGTTLTGEWEDHAAGIYVAKESHFTTEDVTLNITVSGDGSGLQGKTLVPIHGIIVGQDEAAAKYSGEHSNVTLKGSTNINLSVNSSQNNGRYSGISVVGGSKLEAHAPVFIQSELKEKIDFSEGQQIDIYGVSAGTYLADTIIASYSHSGSANFYNGLTVKTPTGYNPALNHFIALHSNNTWRYSGEFGGIYIDNREKQNVVQIEGLTKTERSGFVNLKLSGKDSFISGAMESITWDGLRDGFIYLRLENGATWNVLENLDRDKYDKLFNKRESQVYHIDLASGGSINLSRPDHYNKFFEQSPYQTVKVWDYLNGNDRAIADSTPFFD